MLVYPLHFKHLMLSPWDPPPVRPELQTGSIGGKGLQGYPVLFWTTHFKPDLLSNCGKKMK